MLLGVAISVSACIVQHSNSIVPDGAVRQSTQWEDVHVIALITRLAQLNQFLCDPMHFVPLVSASKQHLTQM